MSIRCPCCGITVVPDEPPKPVTKMRNCVVTLDAVSGVVKLFDIETGERCFVNACWDEMEFGD